MSKKSRIAVAQRKQDDNNSMENTIRFGIAPKAKPRNIDLIPKTLTQERYITSLLNQDKNIVIAYGPAGTGKTYLAMLAAIKALQSGECQKIILSRPAVGVEEEEHGFLPGDLTEKMTPWCRPLFDILREYFNPREIERMLDEQIVEISPLAFMRGRSLKDCWIIADEMQSSTMNQMKMLLTRIGENCKLIVTGDLEQVDRKGANGLSDFLARLHRTPKSRITALEFLHSDIRRSPIVKDVLDLYNEEP